MAKGKDSRTEGEQQMHTDGGTVAASPSETLVDSGTDSAEAATVAQPVEAEIVETHPVQIDQVFTILKNQRRRSVLQYLQTVDGEVTLSTLAEQLAAWECDKDVSQITSSERKRVYVGLYQSHLPKMDDVGAISYNKPRGKIEPGENRALFEHYLPAETDDAEHAPAEYYWVLPVVVGLFALALSVLWLLI